MGRWDVTEFEDAEMGAVAGEDVEEVDGRGYGDVVKGEPENREEDVVPGPVDEDAVEEMAWCEVWASALAAVVPQRNVESDSGEDLWDFEWVGSLVHDMRKEEGGKEGEEGEEGEG
ncbi:hypothetical protein BGZ54_007033 [Gamsiella multidivaricata]|nr:hypothetical protein BGZ54_007033 [Gamsiella multidivaricata]